MERTLLSLSFLNRYLLLSTVNFLPSTYTVVPRKTDPPYQGNGQEVLHSVASQAAGSTVLEAADKEVMCGGTGRKATLTISKCFTNFSTAAVFVFFPLSEVCVCAVFEQPFILRETIDSVRFYACTALPAYNKSRGN